MSNEMIPVNVESLERQGSIAVQRLRVTGSNYFGRPNVEDLMSHDFTSLVSALEWSIESPEYSHHFIIPLPGLNDLSAELRGERRDFDRELLIVHHKENNGVSPRSVDNHHAVSTDYESFFDLIVDLEPNQLSLFDRGVVWVGLYKNGLPPTLKFHINAGVHTASEIEAGILQMLTRVDKVLSALVQGRAS